MKAPFFSTSMPSSRDLILGAVLLLSVASTSSTPDAGLSALHVWLDSLATTASTSSSSSSPPASSIAFSLARARGKVAVGAVPAGRGLVAGADLFRGELLMEIPRAAIMTRTSARDSVIGHLLRRLPGPTALAVHLLYERHLGASSRFAAYIGTMPLGPPTSTCCFADGRPLTRDEEATLCRVEDALFRSCPSVIAVEQQRAELVSVGG